MANLVPSLSPDVFNQGAVRVNSDALTNYIINTQARNQARDQAFTKYIADKGNTLTPTGMRAQETPELLAAKNDFQTHAIQNRHALQNPSVDHGRAYMESQNKFNKMQALIAASKDQAKKDQEFEAVLKDPNKRRLLTDNKLGEYQKSQLSINDPNFHPVGMEDIYNPKPWTGVDQGRLANELKGVTGTYTARTPEPIGGGMQTVTYDRSFDQNDLTNMSAKAHTLINEHPGFKNYIEDTIAHPESTIFHDLNTLYKKHFGKNIEQPEEAATAYILSQNPNPETKADKPQKIPLEHLSPDQKFNEFKKRVDYRNAHRPAKVGSTKVPDMGTPIHDEFSALIDNASKPGGSLVTRETYDNKGNVEKTVKGYILPLTPQQKSAYNIRNADGKIATPSEVVISEDKKTVTPIYKGSATSSTGHSEVQRDISNGIPVHDAEAQYGAHKYTKAQVLKEKKILNQQAATAPMTAEEADKYIKKYSRK